MVARHGKRRLLCLIQRQRIACLIADSHNPSLPCVPWACDLHQPSSTTLDGLVETNSAAIDLGERDTGHALFDVFCTYQPGRPRYSFQGFVLPTAGIRAEGFKLPILATSLGVLVLFHVLTRHGRAILSCCRPAHSSPSLSNSYYGMLWGGLRPHIGKEVPKRFPALANRVPRPP